MLVVVCFPLSTSFGGRNTEGLTLWGYRLATAGTAGRASVVHLVPLTVTLHVPVRFLPSALGRRPVTGSPGPTPHDPVTRDQVSAFPHRHEVFVVKADRAPPHGHQKGPSS